MPILGNPLTHGALFGPIQAYDPDLLATKVAIEIKRGAPGIAKRRKRRYVLPNGMRISATPEEFERIRADYDRSIAKPKPQRPEPKRGQPPATARSADGSGARGGLGAGLRAVPTRASPAPQPVTGKPADSNRQLVLQRRRDALEAELDRRRRRQLEKEDEEAIALLLVA